MLLVDVSGSMRGERVRTAAATVGALAGRAQPATTSRSSRSGPTRRCWCRLGEQVPPLRLLDLLLRMPAQGLTNVAFAAGRSQRASWPRVPARDARRGAAVATACTTPGPTRGRSRARLPRLDVLLDTSGEHDAELGRELARLGRGRLRRIRGYTDVAPALGAIFTD